MIDIVLTNGDEAEAETPEAAVVAALTMIDDVFTAFPVLGVNIKASFYVDGKCILHELSRIQLRSMK